MKKMTTEEKLNKCIEFLKKFEEREFYEVQDTETRCYDAYDVDEFKNQVWHLLVDISD